MSEYKEITDKKYRCSIGACPAVFKSEDGKTRRITGEHLMPPHGFATTHGTETTIEISADLLLASLGVNELVEAAQDLIKDCEEHGWVIIPGPPDTLDRIQSALSRIKGEN